MNSILFFRPYTYFYDKLNVNILLILVLYHIWVLKTSVISWSLLGRYRKYILRADIYCNTVMFIYTNRVKRMNEEIINNTL